ncbi:hypothetical protein ACB092_11G275100 [Castanea dentata]
MDQFGAVSQQKSYHPLLPFVQQKWAKEKETLPLFLLCSFRFCNFIPTTYAMADEAKDRIVCKATGRAGYMSTLRWWSSKSSYTQTVALVSNKSKYNKKRLCPF